MFLDKIVIGSRVAPLKGLQVCFGVVTGVFRHSSSEQAVYEVLTDFGNFFKFTESEFCEIYTNEVYYQWDELEQKLDDFGAVDNLTERLTQHILNLQLALEDLQQRGAI